MSRIVSLYVFAVVAHRVDAGQLGALALGTAFAGGAYALAPAIVGKPLAAMADHNLRVQMAAMAQSAAAAGSVIAAVILVPVALLTHGLVQLAFIGGIIGIPTVMIVESNYWQSVFVDGPRSAGLTLTAAYVAQAVIVTVGSAWLGPEALVIASFAALGAPALAIAGWKRDLKLHFARQWMTTYRRLWLPYVVGVAALVALVQAIPTVLSATAGFAAASTYRAGELAFGGTNLLIGISTQSLLTQSTDRPRSVYARVSVTLLFAAGVNGAAVGDAPASFLRTFVGPTAPLLLDVLTIVTVQRAALAVSSIGAVLLVPRISARAYGLLDVLTAGISLTVLVVGGITGGLRGALIGLAAIQVVFAISYLYLLRRST